MEDIERNLKKLKKRIKKKKEGKKFRKRLFNLMELAGSSTKRKIKGKLSEEEYTILSETTESSPDDEYISQEHQIPLVYNEDEHLIKCLSPEYFLFFI